MGCETMPTKSSLDPGMQDREALQLVLENLSMIGLNSTLFEKDARPTLTEDSDQVQVERKRVSANITENIPVPSSEHVAEIVGKQGCKIKALRNKTNTYIKTPGRGDEPVFIITGRREDVDMAKAEILQASEHFSNIRAQRKGVAPPPIQPGQITKTIRVPYRVVGLVVGPKGQTIKQIQQKTQTYIVTPSRERDPVFEITGVPESVEQARVEISNYIAARTGTFIDSEKKAIAPAVSVPTSWTPERSANSYQKESVMPEEINEFLEEIFSGGSNRSPSLKSTPRKRNSLDLLSSDESPHIQNGINGHYVMWNHGFNGNLKSVLPITNASLTNSDILHTSNSNPSSSVGSSFSFEASSPLVRSSSFPVCSSENSSVVGEAVGTTTRKTAETQGPAAHASWSTTMHDGGAVVINETSSSSFLTSNSINQTDNGRLTTIGVDSPNELSIGGSNLDMNFVSAHCRNGVVPAAAAVSMHLNNQVANGCLAKNNGSGLINANCIICECNRISAALVPCGHNLFCYDCVSSLVQSNNAFCPVCHQPADHALRILQ